jgi:hypothetical protein
MVLCWLAKISSAQTTKPWPAPLLASGSGDRFFIALAQTDKDGKHKTMLRGQVLPGGEWYDFGVVWGQAAGLAQVQGDAAILFSDGTWKRVGQTFSTGTNLPGEGPVLAWASGKAGVYGVRAAEGGAESFHYAPVTQPATRPTTRSTTRASDMISKPVLFVYERRDWTALVDLPAAAGDAIELCIAGSRPVVAAQLDGVVKTWSLSEKVWSDWGDVNTGSVARFGLLPTSSGAALWTIDQNGAIKLYLRGETSPWKQVDVKMPGGVPADARRVLAFAGEEFRLVVLKENKFFEQRYAADGAMRGEMGELPVARAAMGNPFSLMYQMLVLLAMALIMVLAIYRRKKLQEQEKEEEE